jgi:hypothetical protein
MTKKKDFKARLLDMRSHATLLLEACDRFIKDYKYDEIRNIGVRLRALVGTGKGNGLLFELAKETCDKFQVMSRNQYGILKITEMEHGTNRILQEVEKQALLTKIPGRLPIVFSFHSENTIYRLKDLREWIESGFLLDWDVPEENGTSKTIRFTPQVLINRYTGQEAVHSDSSYGIFGGPVESLTMEYTIQDKRIIVPIVYEYLFQIGRVVAEIALNYIEKWKDA